MSQNTYATVAQFIAAVDSRVVQRLSSDTDSDGSLASTNSIISTALKRGSADVEAAALRGERYSTVDLTAFADDEDWTLIGLVIDRALVHLFARRASSIPDDLKERMDKAGEMLQMLADGERIFRDTGSAAAGKPSYSVPSIAERSSQGLMSDLPFFPSRPETI